MTRNSFIRGCLVFIRVSLAVITFTFFSICACLEASLFDDVINNELDKLGPILEVIILIKLFLCLLWMTWIISRTVFTHTPPFSKTIHIVFGSLAFLPISVSIVIFALGTADYLVVFTMGVVSTISILLDIAITEIRLLISPNPAASAPSRGPGV